MNWHRSDSAPLFAPRSSFHRLWLGRVVWPLALFAAYATSYFIVRVKGTDRAGSPEVHCTSRMSQILFNPLIRAEQSLACLWNAGPSKRPEARSFEETLRQAQDTHRKVLLTVGTTSCLPCRQLERFLKEQEPILSRYFLVAKTNVDDDKRQGEAIHQRYRQDKGTSAKFRYFPWMAFLDADGNTIVTGDDGPPGTIGIPQGGPADREWFLKMLRMAAPEISEEEMAELELAALRFHQRIWESRNAQD